MAAPVQEPAARERRRRAKTSMLGRGHEYMDLDQELYDVGPTPSARGCGPVGFTGTVRRAAVARPTGLTALAGAAWGGTTTVPMMPSSWEPDSD